MAIREWRLVLPSETIKFNNKEYEIKRKLSFGEVRKFQKVLGNVIVLDKKMKDAPSEELEAIATENLRNTTEQMDLIEDTLRKCLEFTDEQLNTLSFQEVITLFNQVFTDSTQLKKNLSQPYV